MTISYSALCDNFCIDTYINTKLDLPNARDTLLTFFERIQKQYPTLCNLYRDNNGRYVLDEDDEQQQGRWVSIDIDRVGTGAEAPSSFEEVFGLTKLVIDLVPYMLGISSLDVESLDLTFAMDFDCSDNHNEIIAEALFHDSAFSSLFELPGAGPIELSPAVVVALDDDCRTRVRVGIESKTDELELRRGKFSQDKPISLYLTVRQYPTPGKKFSLCDSFDEQCRLATTLMDEKIIPNFVMPLANVIAQRR